MAGQGGIPPVPVAGARAAPGALSGRLRLPEGPGPHAVMILLHGCGGLGPNVSQVWAERLVGWGYGSLLLDSFGARSVASVYAPSRQGLMTRFDRAGDVVAAARWPGRCVGWWTTMAIAETRTGMAGCRCWCWRGMTTRGDCRR